MECRETRELRHLFIDGEIDPLEAPQVEAHLAACVTCRRLYDEEHAMSAALRTHAKRWPVPPALRTAIERALREKDATPFLRRWQPLAAAASLVLAITLSSSLTALYLQPSPGDSLAQEVVASHIRSLMADHLTDIASSDQHTVKPWFDGKIDVAPPVIDLGAEGFPLLGGRLDYLDHRPVAALVYGRRKHVINVLVQPTEGSNSHEGDDHFSRQGYNLVHLVRNDLDFWAVSDLDAAELTSFIDRLVATARPLVPKS
ncbi:MAG TPA: anti-sigma factor [Stellaceae bacterium]|nr:anti-sigma factor [Stellaceae bacterium]